MKKNKILICIGLLTVIGFNANVSFAQETKEKEKLPAISWQWSKTLQGYYYRDNDGRVRYGDGSVSHPSTTWSNSKGKTVYSANSAGPADKSGKNAIQSERIDDSNIGPAPTTPPTGYVIYKHKPGTAVFGGTDPNRVKYVDPSENN